MIIPAKIDMITDYNRDFSCARARFVELQTVICVLGAVGLPFGQAMMDTGVGEASIFTPSDVEDRFFILRPRTSIGSPSTL